MLCYFLFLFIILSTGKYMATGVIIPLYTRNGEHNTLCVNSKYYLHNKTLIATLLRKQAITGSATLTTMYFSIQK